MWNNFINRPVNLPTVNDITFKITDFSLEKRTCKQIKFERELSLETDTDFQSFLLPLKQDFTKSSKGYASLFTSIANNEFKSDDFQNESKGNRLLCDIPDNDYFRNSSSTNLSHNFLSSNEHDHVNNACLYYQKCEKLIHNTLKNNEDDETAENSFFKKHTKIIHCTLHDSHKEDHVFVKQECICSEKCMKTICDVPTPFSDAGRLNDESEIERYNNSQDCANDSSSDDSIIFLEEDVINKSCSNADGDFAFEYDAVDFKNTPDLENNIDNSVIVAQTEGCVNAAFEDNDFLSEQSSNILKSINESWNDSMKDVSGEPHKPKRVSFVPLSSLVSVFSYEPDDDDYCYSLYVLDQLRFQDRIKEFEHTIAPYLTPTHRANIYKRNCLQD